MKKGKRFCALPGIFILIFFSGSITCRLWAQLQVFHNLEDARGQGFGVQGGFGVQRFGFDHVPVFMSMSL